MGVLHLLSFEGDTTVAWDLERASVGDIEAEEAVREAERIFEEAKKKGATAFSVVPGSPPKVLERFDPEAERIVVVPRVQGG